MDENELEITQKLADEFHVFKKEINEKMNLLIDRQNSEFKIFEDILCKLDDMSRIIENSNEETKKQLTSINEVVSEKIAMLMLRKF